MTRMTITILPAVALAFLTSAVAVADQPPPSASATKSQDFKAVIQEAIHHAYEADEAGSHGDADGLKRHAYKALDKAKEGQRVGHNERLNDGVYALGDAIEHADHNTDDATEHIKRAIMKLSQSANVQLPEGAQIADTKGTGHGSSSESGRRGAYSGGYFDDGFVDDDWFYDYYDIQSSEASSRSDSAAARRTDYQAEQLYEDARTSGLFDF